MELLELMEIPPPGEISLPLIPLAGALLGESGALLMVEVGRSQEMSGAARRPAAERSRKSPAGKQAANLRL